MDFIGAARVALLEPFVDVSVTVIVEAIADLVGGLNRALADEPSPRHR